MHVFVWSLFASLWHVTFVHSFFFSVLQGTDVLRFDRHCKFGVLSLMLFVAHHLFRCFYRLGVCIYKALYRRVVVVMCGYTLARAISWIL